jgi:hypothetical protein
MNLPFILLSVLAHFVPIQGSWRIESAVFGDRDVTEIVKGARVRIDRESIQIESEERFRIRVDPFKSPPHVDLINDEGKVWKGRYMLGESGLILCYPLRSESVRPDGIPKSRDANLITLRLKRSAAGERMK